MKVDEGGQAFPRPGGPEVREQPSKRSTEEMLRIAATACYDVADALISEKRKRSR